MALTFSQGRQSGQAPFRSRYADLDYTAADAFKPFKDQVDTQKKKVDEKIDAFRKSREEMENVSDTSMWGEHYDTLRQKAQLLASEEVMDRYMDSKDGQFRYEQMIANLNEEITLAEEAYKNQKGSSQDDPTAGTQSAAEIRALTPNRNAFGDKGFEPTLTIEEARAIADDMNRGKTSVMRINENDEFEWNVDSGEGVGPVTQKGSIVVRDNPFDPKLEEVDISGFTFFRDRDDGKFDDFAEVESFIRTQVKENADFAQMALRHYINETGIKEPSESELQTYLPRAMDMWVDEARDAFNRDVEATKLTEGDKKRLEEKRLFEQSRQGFFDSITVVETERPKGKQSQVSLGVFPDGVSADTSVNIPLGGVKGFITVNDGGEEGVMNPMNVVVSYDENGKPIIEVTGFFNPDKKQTGSTSEGERKQITVTQADPEYSELLLLVQNQYDVSLNDIVSNPLEFQPNVTSGFNTTPPPLTTNN